MTKTKIFRMVGLLALAIGAMALIGYMYRTGPQAAELVWNPAATKRPTVPILVDYGDDFDKPTQYAIALWNDIMPTANGGRGADLFIVGTLEDAQPGESVVRVLSANGEPCGDPWRPEAEDGHSATAYQCPRNAEGVDVWEIHVNFPGDLHDQLCIVAHELGHVLGLADESHPGTPGVMNNRKCADVVRVNDKDAAAIVERYEYTDWGAPGEFKRLRAMEDQP